MRVLLVDDDDLLREALTRRLRTRGMSVDSAGGVREALELLERNRYELIISDENMDDGDGHSLLGVVAERQPKCRRVLMSALEAPPGIPIVWERFFAKPDDVDELVIWSSDQARAGTT